MRCPYCGGKTRVIHTESYDDFIERVRRCLVCGRYFKTVEVRDVEIQRVERDKQGDGSAWGRRDD